MLLPVTSRYNCCNACSPFYTYLSRKQAGELVQRLLDDLQLLQANREDHARCYDAFKALAQTKHSARKQLSWYGNPLTEDGEFQDPGNDAGACALSLIFPHLQEEIHFNNESFWDLAETFFAVVGPKSSETPRDVLGFAFDNGVDFAELRLLYIDEEPFHELLNRFVMNYAQLTCVSQTDPCTARDLQGLFAIPNRCPG